MRPQVLFPLFATLTSLPGIGPKLAKLVEKVAGPHVVNLLWHLPQAVIDRRYAPALTEAEAGRMATVEVTVDEHQAPRNPVRLQLASVPSSAKGCAPSAARWGRATCSPSRCRRSASSTRC